MVTKNKKTLVQTIIVGAFVVAIVGLGYTVTNQNAQLRVLNEQITTMEKSLKESQEITNENQSESDNTPPSTSENEREQETTVSDGNLEVNNAAVQDVSETQNATKVNTSSIGYTLPDGWTSEIRDNGTLFISAPEGGYVVVNVYDFPANIGRRTFFCQITEHYCLDQTTFNPIQIGNMSGYEALMVDNSGGGNEYFGTVGGSFIWISTFSPSSPVNNPFDQGIDSLLKSFVF
jgi:hypothetical protein